MKSTRTIFALTAAVLSAMAAGEPVKHNYDLKHVLWKLSFDMSKGTISGDVTNTVTLSEASPTVEFHCSELKVSKVLVDGKPAKFSTANDKLTVTLPAAGTANQTLHIRSIYTGAPTNGFYFVPASRAFPSKYATVYTQGQGEDNHFWLPTYDLPDDKATTECYVEVPPKWKAISNGVLKAVSAKGKNKVYHWLMEQPHSTYLISLVAGEYVEVKDKWRHIPVTYHVPPGLEREGKASFGATPRMVDFFSRITGVDYPYGKFTQTAVADYMYGGMENTTAVTQTIRTLHPPEAEPIHDSTGLVAHELAHQWFGDLVTCRTWEHSWINEGFATALQVLYFRESRGEDVFGLERYRNFEGAVDTIGSRSRKEMNVEIGSSAQVNVGSVYDGGASRIMMLMHDLGEDVFWKGIKQFLTTYGFKPVVTDEFFEVMSAASGRDLSAFKKQWFYTPATPSISVALDGNQLLVKQLAPHYSLELPVWILNNDTWEKRQVSVSGAESRLDLGELAGKPLLIDPEVWTPMELRYEMKYSAQDIASLYRNAPNTAQKARIVATMFDSLPVSDRIAIGHTEKFYGLLQMIANKIDQQGAWYLLELTKHPDKRVVNTAVQAIGRLKSEPSMVTRLNEISTADSNPAVRQTAVQALLGWTKEPALAQKAWAMKSFDDGYRRMALDWWAKNDPNTARAKALAVLAKPDSEPLRITAIHVLGRVKESNGSAAQPITAGAAKSKPESSPVYSALARVAKETSYHARSAAINALGELGNKSAIAVLEPITKSAPWGIRGDAQRAIERLKEGLNADRS